MTTQQNTFCLTALTAQFSGKYLHPTEVPSLSLRVSIEAASEAGRRCEQRADSLSPLHPPRSAAFTLSPFFRTLALFQHRAGEK